MEAIYDNHNFITICEFLPNHLYFVTVQNINNGGSCDAIIPHTDDIHYFNTDNELIYHNFYGDFGPLNITCLYKFCKKLTNKMATYAGDVFYEKFTNSRFGRKDIAEQLKQKFVKKKIVVYYTSTNNEKRANAAFLIASFAVLYLGYSPRLAYKALQPMKMRYRPFQDASVGLSPYKISMKSCLDALHKASIFGFFNFNDFNATECSYYENIEHGDLNWIIPQKFIAFPGPVEEKNDYYHHPNFYIEYFLCNNVTDIIRLNQRAYDAKCFTMFNIKHHDLYMQDGTDPPETILKSFMHIAETASGAIAVHCKAGLGRTGSLIGAYLLKHYRMTAKEAIAWIRICRPGSVIGHQQTWLENHEESLWYEGNEWRYKMYGKKEIVPFLPFGIYSHEAPKKEFPGLRELLTNLTKRSRYRFIVKNRTKKSKTRLQQVIKNLLENGKCSKPQSVESHTDKLTEESCAERNLSGIKDRDSSELNITESKNVHYLKPPPQMESSENPQMTEKQSFSNGYSQLEYRKPVPPANIVNPYEPIVNYHNAIDNYYNSSVYQRMTNPYADAKLQAMYSNPNAFYSNPCPAKEYSQEKKQVNAVPSVASPLPKTNMPSEISSIYSDPTPLVKYESRKTDLLSKSIDKNWKQNVQTSQPVRHYPIAGENINKRHYPSKVMLKPPEKINEEVCAFDTRVDTISRYSRFNKPYLNKGPVNRTDVNAASDADYFSDAKLKGYENLMKHPERSSHGFLLSPEDLQSWVETFEEKPSDAVADKKITMKRSSVI